MQDQHYLNNQHSDLEEGSLTKRFEHQTAKIPSSYFLIAAGGAVLLSLALASTSKRKDWANFIGNWVPSIMLLGIYNKIVKTHGHDMVDNHQETIH